MTIVMAPPETWADEAACDDDDLTHIFCCDETVALCGLDLSAFDILDDDGEVGVCPACAYVEDRNLPCPVRGCSTIRRAIRRFIGRSHRR